jgi:hypothetical protein
MVDLDPFLLALAPWITQGQGRHYIFLPVKACKSALGQASIEVEFHVHLSPRGARLLWDLISAFHIMSSLRKP